MKGIKTSKIEKSNDSNGIRLSFSATLENVDRAANEVKDFFSRVHVKDRTFDIILGIREALINSVTHGSRKDSKKNVTCTLRLEGDELIVEVEDEGAGFDWKARLDKNLPTREESGRGLALMKESFSKIKYIEKGNRLILIQKI